jgi:hypothetical protein
MMMAIYLMGSKLQTLEFLVMLDEPDRASVQTILFDAGYECFQGNYGAEAVSSGKCLRDLTVPDVDKKIRA